MNTRAKRWSGVLGCGCALVGVSWLIAAEPASPAKSKKTKDKAEVTVSSKSALMVELERGDASSVLAPSKRCEDNSDCRDREYCALEDGACDGRGTCMRRPQGCPDVWDPVCGCDGVTYGNKCDAAAAGVNVAHTGACESKCCDPALEPGQNGIPFCFEGASCCADGNWACNQADGSPTCPLGEVCVEICGGFAGFECSDPKDFCKTSPGECCCDFFGVCTDIPKFCLMIYDPVCGCDGVTYGNECLADAAGVSVDHAGACGDGCRTNADCAVIGQLFGEFCRKAAGDCDGTGECTPVPQLCLDVWIPVCGCDGKTYSNTCYANRVGVNVASEGECGNDQ